MMTQRGCQGIMGTWYRSWCLSLAFYLKVLFERKIHMAVAGVSRIRDVLELSKAGITGAGLCVVHLGEEGEILVCICYENNRIQNTQQLKENTTQTVSLVIFHIQR